jgi:hypothetical protein
MHNLGTLVMIHCTRGRLLGFLNAKESADHSQVIDLLMLIFGTGGALQARQKFHQILFISIAARRKL